MFQNKTIVEKNIKIDIYNPYKNHIINLTIKLNKNKNTLF